MNRVKKNCILATAALSAAVLITATASCGTADVPAVSEPSPLVFEAKISERLPTYRFELLLEENGSDGVWRYTLSVYDPTADTEEPKGKLIQDFSFKTGNTQSDNPIQLIDMNFDGALDLVINTAQGAGSTGTYEVYPWYESYDIHQARGFLPTPELVYSGCELETCQDGTRQFIVGGQPTAEETVRTLYQVEEPGGYPRGFIRLLRRKSVTHSTQTGKTEVSVSELIDGRWVTVYSTDDDDNVTSENFLRFGAAEPISVRQAEYLAESRYGGRYIEFRQLRTFGGRTYFEFFTCDPVNVSDCESCGVAADGSEIIVF